MELRQFVQDLREINIIIVGIYLRLLLLLPVSKKPVLLILRLLQILIVKPSFHELPMLLYLNVLHLEVDVLTTLELVQILLEPSNNVVDLQLQMALVKPLPQEVLQPQERVPQKNAQKPLTHLIQIPFVRLFIQPV